MYGDDFVRELLEIISGLRRWQEPFDKYRVQIAIVSVNSVLRLQMEESSEWQQIYADEMAIVFRRN